MRAWRPSVRPLKIKNTRRIDGVARPGVLCFLKSQELGRVLAALCSSFLGTGAEQLSAQLGQAKWSGGGRAGEALIINPLDKLPPVSSSCYKRKLGAGLRVHRETRDGKVISCPTHNVPRACPGICEAEGLPGRGPQGLPAACLSSAPRGAYSLPWHSDCTCLFLFFSPPLTECPGGTFGW